MKIFSGDLSINLSIEEFEQILDKELLDDMIDVIISVSTVTSIIDECEIFDEANMMDLIEEFNEDEDYELDKDVIDKIHKRFFGG